MNWDQISEHWHHLQGKVKEKWGKLTDNDLAIISGQHEQMNGLLRKKYGIARAQAEREIDDFARSLKV